MKPVKSIPLGKYDLPPEITPELKVIYDQDDYKYLIHTLRAHPVDNFRILQFLLLRFYPLILTTCRKYKKKGAALPWADLVSLAKTHFINLIFTFKLYDTLYFRTYIPLALDRALCTYLQYVIKRRVLLFDSPSLDAMEGYQRDALFKSSHEMSPPLKNQRSLDESEILQFCRDFVGTIYAIGSYEYLVFIEFFFNKEPIQFLSLKYGISAQKIKKIHSTTTARLRQELLLINR